MKCVLRAWEQLKRMCEVLPLGEICFEGMGGQLQRGFEVFLLGEMPCGGMGTVAKGI